MSKRVRNPRSGSKIEKIKDIASKMNENEKRKIEKRKKEKANKPKGYRARKMGVVSFWFVMALMFLIVLVNAGGGKKASEATVTENAATSKAESSEAVEFSKEFLAEYFTWNLDELNQNERDTKMGYYTSSDLADQLARVDTKEWHSTLKRENILLKDLESLGDNKSLLTFQVNITFNKTVDAIEKEKADLAAAGEEAKAPEAYSADSQDVVLNEQGIVKRITKKKYISVPLFYSQEESRFVVYQIPTFTYYDESPNLSKPEKETDKLRTVVGNETNGIKDFLNTFFEAYASDSKEKLNYLVEDKRYQYGLSKTMEFATVKNINVYEGKTENEKIVSANVVFSEPDTGITFTSHYLMVLMEKEDRFVVKHINSKQYIDELLKKAAEEKEKKKNKASEEDEVETDADNADHVEGEQEKQEGES